jgi:hypothetical protein
MTLHPDVAIFGKSLMIKAIRRIDAANHLALDSGTMTPTSRPRHRP